MLEKLKDILYESSDLLLALVILLVMSSVITWQVSDSMAISSNEHEIIESVSQTSDDSSSLENDVDETPNDMVTFEDNDENITEEDTSEVEIEKPDEVIDDSSTENIEPEKVEEKPTQPSTIVTIEIPVGTPGIGIAKILHNNDLISDTSTFVTRVEELNLAVKLKSGTYKIDSNSTLDDIIYIITGQKR